MTLKKTFINFPEWPFQIFSEMRIFINELYNLLHNFTMTPYCQHTLNFKKKKDRPSQYVEDFPEYIEC